MKITPQLIQSVTATIVREYKPEKVILFGSYAWGKPHKDSDLDLFVVKKTRKKKIHRGIEVQRLLQKVRIPMDILVYTPQELNHQISKNGNIFVEDVLNRGEVLYSK